MQVHLPRRAGARFGGFSSRPFCCWSPPRRGALSGSMPPRRSACAADAWRAQEAKSGRNLRLRQAHGGGLSVPPRNPLRRRQRRAGVADRGRRRRAVHRAARRDPGRRADLRSETADRGISTRRPRCRIRQQPPMRVELEQGARQRGRAAGGAAARLDRVRRCRDRPHRCIRCQVAGRRAPSMSSCTAASPTARRPDHPVIETVLQIDGGSVQERASAAGRAVRCRRPRAC